MKKVLIGLIALAFCAHAQTGVKIVDGNSIEITNPNTHTLPVQAAGTVAAGTAAGNPVVTGVKDASGFAQTSLQSGQTGLVGVAATGASTATFTLSSTSPSSATTAVGATITGLGGYRSLTIFATLTGATGGTLDVYLQTSPDAGTTWVDYAHYTQIVAAAGAVSKSITVSRASQNTTIVTVGTGTTPALAQTTVVGGDFGDRMRVLYVAGASTTAGAAQVILISAAT